MDRPAEIPEASLDETPAVADAPGEPGAGLRFADEAWDDEFCTWLDDGLRTCCG